MARYLVTSLLLFAALGLSAQSGWTPESMIKFKRIGGTRLSADGKWVAYTIATPMMDNEKSEFVSQVWVASTDGKMNLQFTQGDKSCMSPAFSPDGNFLAFLSGRGSEGKAQLFVMRMAGGEAEQWTKSKSGIESFAWSPDSKHIALIQRDSETEQEEKMKKEKKDWTLVDHWKYSHLYTIAVDKSSGQKPERKIKRLTHGEFQVINFDWSPDSKTIAFTHQQSPSADTWTTADISVVPSDSGAVKSLVSGAGFDSSPLYSPDGKNIAYVSSGGSTSWGGVADVYIVPSTGGQPKKLAETPDRQANMLHWSTDSKEIFFTETDHTTNRLFALPVGGGAARLITQGPGTFTGISVSADSKLISYVYQTCDHAPDVFVTALAKWDPKKISDANPDFGHMTMGKTEVIRWKSKDGKEVEGLLTYPVNYKSGQKCPLILNIHGGPAGVFVQTYTGAGAVYPIQAFAQQGYAVLRPNPRGSSGYGKDFRFANYNDWGYGDFEDDMSGVDKVISMGVAHADSLVICGWSYGGYMTSFAVTRTNRFKAASVGAGVTNLMSFVGTADIPSFLPDYFGGEYWDQLASYEKHSAVFNVKNVKTPSQVIHGERDIRVPPSQGFEYYTAMKRLGVPTEMITYPRTPHGVQEPKFIQDIGERIIVWFNKQLGRKGSPMTTSR